MQPRSDGCSNLSSESSVAGVLLLLVPVALGHLVLDDVEVAVREVRVREPVPETEPGLDVVAQEVAISDI